MTIDLYIHPVSPPARAVQVLVRHLGLQVNETTLDLPKGEQNNPDFLKLNPTHTVPTLVDDGLVVFESRAILAYLINKYKPDSTLYSQDPAKRAKVDTLLYFDASGLFPSAVTIFRSKLFRGVDPTEEQLKALQDKVDQLAQLLGDKPFLTGDHVTLADLSIGTYIHGFNELIPVGHFPESIPKWYERVVAAIPELGKLNAEAKLLQDEYFKSALAAAAAAGKQ